MDNETSANISNITGYHASGNLNSNIDLPRCTTQCFILIIYDSTHSQFGKFYNEMILFTPIFKAYGHGEFFGMSKCLKCIEGCFPPNYGIGIISFDNYKQAKKCIESRTSMRNGEWLGGVDIFILPLCNPGRYPADYPFFQLEFYDVKHPANFLTYINNTSAAAEKHGGSVIAATEQITKWKGIRHPQFIFIIQWSKVSDLDAYNNEVTTQLRNTGAACGSRIVFQLEAQNNRCS